jgi:Terminase small subunit
VRQNAPKRLRLAVLRQKWRVLWRQRRSMSSPHGHLLDTITAMANEQHRTKADVPADMPLTARERAFVEEYLLTANGAKAAQAAGYSSKSAKVRAARLMRRPRVIAALRTSTT